MVYSSLHILGKGGYELLIDKAIDLAQEFAQLIAEHPDFELITSPVLSLLTYRLRPSHLSQMGETTHQQMETLNSNLDDLTVAIQKQQREAGKSFVSRTRIEAQQYNGLPTTVFRVVLANPLTTKEDLVAILDEQLHLAKAHAIWKQLAKERLIQIA